jgi:hypothetical protein
LFLINITFFISQHHKCDPPPFLDPCMDKNTPTEDNQYITFFGIPCHSHCKQIVCIPAGRELCQILAHYTRTV